MWILFALSLSKKSTWKLEYRDMKFLSVNSRVVHFEPLLFISLWHLKIVCEMKKKKSSQNLHDVKKHLGVATGD